MPATDPQNPTSPAAELDPIRRVSNAEHAQACTCSYSDFWLASHPTQERTPPINATEPHPSASPEPDDDTPDASPLYSDLTLCPCGAPATEGALCRKCKARSIWLRRQSERERHAKPRRAHDGHRPPKRGPEPDRPRGRRTGR
jgi:hypothetical protein